MGVREQIIFPEIDYDAIDQVRGLDVTITTTRRDGRGGIRASARVGHAVLAGGRARARRPPRREAAEEERRQEEARLKAEAEQAALEELKEENPEAYETPTRPRRTTRATRPRPPSEETQE